MVEVLTEPSSYTQPSAGAVFGTIWFQVNGHTFPEARWSDMVLAVLRGWLEEIDSLMDKDVDQGSLFFMDGPFEVRILKKGDGRWKLVFSKRGSDKDYNTVEVQPSELQKAILNAATIAIEGCLKRKFESKDLRIVEELVRQEG